MPAGIGNVLSARLSDCSAIALPCVNARTRSPGLELRDIGPDRVDDPRHFRAGRKRKRRLDLIFSLHLQDVEKIQGGRVVANPHLSRAGLGQCDVFKRHALRLTPGMYAPGFHGRTVLAFGPNSDGNIPYAPSTHSHSSGRVSRGSMISSTPKASAVRSGERNRFNVVFDLAASRGGIGRCFDVALVRRLHAALDGQRSPVARRPGVAQIQRLRVAVARARDAEAAADQNRDPRRGGLIDRDQRACPGANGSRAFGRASDEEARIVDEVHDRNMKCVADVDQPDHFVAGRRIRRAAAVARVVGHHADRVAIEPRQPRYQRTPVVVADFEERVAIEDGVQNAADVVGLAPIARDDRDQFVLAPVGGVARRLPRRRLPDARWQVRQEPADRLERFFFARDFVVHCSAAARVDLVAAQFFLADLFADAALDHRRTGDKKLAGAPHHQRKMRGDHAHRAESGHRSETCADHRHFAQHRGDLVPRRIRGNVRASDLLDGLDAAASARAVDQADHGNAQPARKLFAVPHFVADLGVGRAATHGEVVAADHDGARVDAPGSDYEVRRRERGELPRVVVRGAPSERPDFVEGPGVEQPVDALAHGETSGVMLALDVGSAAHFARQCLAAPYLVQFRLPAHFGYCTRRTIASHIARQWNVPDLGVRNIPAVLNRLRQVSQAEGRSLKSQAIRWLTQSAERWAERAELCEAIRAEREAMFRRNGPGTDSVLLVRQSRDERCKPK